jgi:hypothetical protein
VPPRPDVTRYEQTMVSGTVVHLTFAVFTCTVPCFFPLMCATF